MGAGIGNGRGRAALVALAAIIGVSAATESAIAVDLVIAPVAAVPPTATPPPAGDSCSGNTAYASAGYLHMARSPSVPTPLVSLNTPGLGDALDAADFVFGWNPGFESRIGVVGCRIGIEAGAFWIRPWFAEAFSFAGVEVDAFIETNPPSQNGGISNIYGANRSQLWGVDANVVAQVTPNLLVYAGLAYVRLRDTLTIQLDQLNPPSTSGGTFVWDVVNSMVGPQIGARATIGPLTPGSFFLGLEGRGGLLLNSVSHALTVDRPNPDPGDLTGNDAISTFSMMAAGSARLGFQATAHLAFSVGYMAMWLNNVALSPAQVSQTPELGIPGPATVPIGTTATGTFFTHGATVGIHLTF